VRRVHSPIRLSVRSYLQGIRPLLPPACMVEELGLESGLAATIARWRRDVARVMRGKDDRLLVIVGPCSVHDPAAALEYAARLKHAAKTYQEDLLIVMRVYFEKPRTTVGWKGLINDPDLDGSFKVNKGLRTARELLLKINRMGLPAGTEFLDTISPQYTADLVSWGAIGARTTESQVHREMSSALRCVRRTHAYAATHSLPPPCAGPCAGGWIQLQLHASVGVADLRLAARLSATDAM
jgi:3-deoxy-7-phosphoheptulonate synthase